MKFDKNLITEIHEKGIKKIKVFFYDAGCSGLKVDIIFDDFEEQHLTPTLSCEERENIGFQVYIEKEDAGKFEDCSITRIQKADHTGNVKTRYIYTSEKVLDRCGCGTSFGFEKKKPKIDLSKLKNLKNNFKETIGK